MLATNRCDLLRCAHNDLYYHSAALSANTLGKAELPVVKAANRTNNHWNKLHSLESPRKWENTWQNRRSVCLGTSHSPNVADRKRRLRSTVGSADRQLDSSWHGQTAAWKHGLQANRELTLSFHKEDAVFIVPLHRKAKGDSS